MPRSSSPPPQISNPRRILLVGARNSEKLSFLKELTGSLPQVTRTALSSAGLSHVYVIRTGYYQVEVPIWVDEWVEEEEEEEEGRVTLSSSADTSTSTTTRKTTSTPPTTVESDTTAPPDPPGPLPWSQLYHHPTSLPVLRVLGSIILCFRKPPTSILTPGTPPQALTDAIKAVGSILRACGAAWDGVALAVGMPGDGVITTATSSGVISAGVGEMEGGVLTEEDILTDLCQQHGLEYIDYEKTGRKNEYGERMGMERVREALEANDWDNEGADLELDFDSENNDFDEEYGDGEEGGRRDVLSSVASEFEREMFGLRAEIGRGSGDGGSGGAGRGEGGLNVDSIFDALDNEEETEGEGEGGEETERKQVEDLERVMAKIAMLRDLSGDDEEKVQRERRKLAREVLREIMREGQEVEGESGRR